MRQAYLRFLALSTRDKIHLISSIAVIWGLGVLAWAHAGRGADGLATGGMIAAVCFQRWRKGLNPWPTFLMKTRPWT